MNNSRAEYIDAAIQIISLLGFPKEQQNERSALCLLALLNLTPGKDWAQAEKPFMGITPIMNWCEEHYGKAYAPNSRETFRRFTIHQFCDAGIVVMNPDDPSRPVNSPNVVYQIEPLTLTTLRSFGTQQWQNHLELFLATHESLVEQYAQERKQIRVPVQIAPKREIDLSPGDHSELIRDVIEKFAPRFAPNSVLIYVGDTGEKWAYYDKELCTQMGVVINHHGKMPDVILFLKDKNWLFLVESVTSHGPVNGKRHSELKKIFFESKAELIYVTAFPNRSVLSRYIGEIAWETEVWLSEAPSHLIHFNGMSFLGPYLDGKEQQNDLSHQN